MSLEGAIQGIDQGAESVFGYREADTLGKDITMLLPYLRKSEYQSVKGSSKVRLENNLHP